MKIERIKFPEPYQYKQVEAGQHDTVWYMPVTGGYIAFIDEIGVTYHPNCYYEFIVDGTLVEKVQRTLSITQPKHYDPPIIARKYIKWVFYNNDSEAHVAEVLCEGYLCKPIW